MEKKTISTTKTDGFVDTKSKKKGGGPNFQDRISERAREIGKVPGTSSAIPERGKKPPS